MGFELITEKPWWFILFCLIAGTSYSLLLYYRDDTFSELHLWIKRLMAAFRFMVVTFIAFLLLSPLIRTISRKVEKPIVIIAQDNSQSIIIGKDSAFYKNQYSDAINKLSKNLGDDYEVKTFSFGDRVTDKLKFSFDEKQTDFSELFDNLSIKYDNRNVGAVILASDGIYNAGSSPLYANDKLKVPFYTIALGDTTARKDLVLTKVNANKIAFLGNSFPLEIIIDARQCSGQTSVLTIEKDSVVISSRPIQIGGNKFHSSIPIYIDAKQKGLQRFNVKLSTLSGELSTANNVATVFVEVIESKQKVLLLANAPHPDIAAIKNAIELSQNYEIKTAFINNFDGGFNDYNLVILYQLPSVANNAAPVFEKLKNSDVSVLYILGTQTNVSGFNGLAAGLTISSGNNRTNEVQAAFNNNFSLFTLNDETKRLIETLPPLISPFGIYKSNEDAYVLLYQKIGNVNTRQPLLFFNQTSERKTGILAGEGLWKWRFKEFSEINSQAITNDFIQKIVQYLAVKEKKTPFKVKYKNNFNENETVTFDAELFNQSDELINVPDVNITITNSDGKSYPFSFSKTDKAYTLNAGYFPVGNYNFKSQTKSGDKIYEQAGQFSVSALQAEQAVSIADHQLLNTLALRSGGQLIYPNELEKISALIAQRKDITSISYTQKQLKDLVNLKWVFFLIMALLSAEWFLRKRSGGY